MSAGQRPRKRFGQHFLADRAVVDRIVAAIDPKRDQTIVEIGPGRGAISVPLAERAGRFHAIEIDRDLAAALQTRFAGRPEATIHTADVLEFDFAALGDELRIVGNLPYNISTPLLFRLTEFTRSIRDMHFMLQKEVVERMAAAPGGKTYGRLTVMLGCCLATERLFDVPPGAFRPAPKVTSSLVRLEPLPDGLYAVEDRGTLSRIVARAFSHRRKTLRNAMKGCATEAELIAAGMDPGARPERATIANYVALANRLARC